MQENWFVHITLSKMIGKSLRPIDSKQREHKKVPGRSGISIINRIKTATYTISIRGLRNSLYYRSKLIIMRVIRLYMLFKAYEYQESVLFKKSIKKEHISFRRRYKNTPKY